MDKVSQQLKNQNKGAKEVATTSNGAPVETITASQTAGERGPILLQDFTLIDHIAAFDRERIPERVRCSRTLTFDSDSLLAGGAR